MSTNEVLTNTEAAKKYLIEGDYDGVVDVTAVRWKESVVLADYRARSLMALGRFDEADALLRSAIEEYPDADILYYRYVVLLLACGYRDGAVSLIQVAELRGLDTPKVAAARVRLCARWKQASDYLTMELVKAPDEALLHLLRAYLYRARPLQRAIFKSELEQAKALDPTLEQSVKRSLVDARIHAGLSVLGTYLVLVSVFIVAVFFVEFIIAVVIAFLGAVVYTVILIGVLRALACCGLRKRKKHCPDPTYWLLAFKSQVADTSEEGA